MTTKKQPQTKTVAEAYNDNTTDTQDMDISTTSVSDSNDVDNANPSNDDQIV